MPNTHLNRCKILSHFSILLLIIFFSFFSVSCDKKNSDKLGRKSQNGPKALDTVPDYKCTVTVGGSEEILNHLHKEMQAGTVVCLAPGVYRDLAIFFGGEGSQENPIVFKSQVPGSATISGVSTIRMTGNYVVLQGFIFQNGQSGPKSLISTAVDKIPCRYCRITENSMINWDSSNGSKNSWIYDAGQHNRIDHNWFSGKPNRGMMVLIDRNNGEPDYTHIDHNYFGNRAALNNKAYPGVNDTNLEVIRVGSSRYHSTNSFSKISYNLFENIRSETEIVSIKSSKNIFHGNTIRGSYGSISNRHGANNIYSNNFIFGEDYPFAGGFRITDAGHIIVNNYIDQVMYPGTSHQGAIVLLRSEVDSEFEPGFSGYKRVRNVVIAHNTIVNSSSSLVLAGGSKKFVPTEITVVNNVIGNAVGPVLTYLSKGIPKESLFTGNLVYGNGLTDSPDVDELEGFTFQNPLLVKTTNIYRPSPDSPVIKKAQHLYSKMSTQAQEIIKFDMDGHLRGDNPDIGADQVVSDEEPSIYPLTSEMVGPKSYSVPRL